MRYRCRVGHAWTAETLAQRQDEALESALWMALRTLEDKAALHRRIARNAQAGAAPHVAEWNDRSAREAAESARLIRAMLTHEHAEPA